MTSNKKADVPDSSIGVDVEQPLTKKHNEIIAETAELYNRQATNDKSPVLYLALEDDNARLQRRLYKMFGMEGSKNLRFATQSKNLNEGLEEQLHRFVKEYEDTRLIIIDTLQKVRKAGGDKLSYGNDYEIVTKLKKFSDHYGICLLVVHHTRKMESSDSFDMISGTNGLLGAADGAFIMQKEKRTENRAILEVAGRDQQDQRLLLNFNREKCVWELTKAETELWKEPVDSVLESLATVVTVFHIAVGYRKYRHYRHYRHGERRTY